MSQLADFFVQTSKMIEIEISKVKGSSPREVGARLYVSQDKQMGTIGGGQLEYMAIDKARILLRSIDTAKSWKMAVPLGPEIGQCCGGKVVLTLRLMDQTLKQQRLQEQADEQATRPNIYIFGAGHIGRALANSLSLLPVSVTMIDSRAEEVALCTANIKTCLTPLPEAHIRTADPGSAFIIATHDHALDFLLAKEALARQDARYVGMIGSKTKAARFGHWLAEEAPMLSRAQLKCPMGLPAPGAVKDKRPEVIAALITADVISALNQGSENQKPLRTRMDAD
ncbi:MAG: xanthine dehydrogenase accessory protein XdhC [Cohaesibacter sp.]|nr:xanthine dehydrogenase accessory protein XdhC [Cohaesibacter sp.]